MLLGREREEGTILTISRPPPRSIASLRKAKINARKPAMIRYF
jgi:hypothetical protein